MAKSRASRRKGLGMFRRLYSPLNHLVGLSRNVGKTAFNTSGKVVNTGLKGVQNIGSAIPRHIDATLSELLSRRRRGERKNTRRNRRGNRKETRRRR